MNEQPKRQPVEPDPPYVAFLVCCQREGGQWRIVLENVATRKRQGFDSVEALFVHLRELFLIDTS